MTAWPGPASGSSAESGTDTGGGGHRSTACPVDAASLAARSIVGRKNGRGRRSGAVRPPSCRLARVRPRIGGVGPEDVSAMNNTHLVANTPRITCVNEPSRAVTRVAVRGHWDSRLRDEVSRVVQACVAETPDALLVDLAGLHDPDGDSAPTWRTAARFASENEPPVAMTLCAVRSVLQQRLSTGALGQSTVVLGDTADTAFATTRQEVDGIRRQHLVLPPQPSACVMARTMAGDACFAFGLGSLAHAVRLTVSELVANAVVHAGTDLDVWVSVRGAGVHVAVQDGSPRLPRLLDIEPWRSGQLLDQPGMGLRVVAAAATAWGALPTRAGKIVWATFATLSRPT